MKQHPVLPRRLTRLLGILACLATGPAYAGNCSNPTAAETAIIYNSAYHTYQFCNGTNWIPYQWGEAVFSQSGFNPPIPAGSGFFVLTKGTYNGNLGGRSGANATCLTDLTTNTGWFGYSTANSRGELISAKVFAFLCDNTACTNLNASTTYFFANAGNSSAGGASFTTDGSGLGPNDNANWAAADYFSGTYNYWTGRGNNSTTQWSSTTGVLGGNFGCLSAWNGTAGGDAGEFGNSAFETQQRWWANTSGSAQGLACALTENLICFVNP